MHLMHLLRLRCLRVRWSGKLLPHGGLRLSGRIRRADGSLL
jgi:hypothetical protein